MRFMLTESVELTSLALEDDALVVVASTILRLEKDCVSASSEAFESVIVLLIESATRIARAALDQTPPVSCDAYS